MKHDSHYKRLLEQVASGKTPSLPGVGSPPRSTAGCVVVEPGNFSRVWIRRSIPNPTYPMRWSFPKGGVDKGETDRDGAVRETEEEIGITAKILDKVGTFDGVKYYLATRSAGPDSAKWKGNGETAEVVLLPWAEAIKRFKSTANLRDVKVVQALVPKIADELGIAPEMVLGGADKELNKYELGLLKGISSFGDTVVTFTRHVQKFQTNDKGLESRIDKMLASLADYQTNATAAATHLAANH